MTTGIPILEGFKSSIPVPSESLGVREPVRPGGRPRLRWRDVSEVNTHFNAYVFICIRSLYDGMTVPPSSGEDWSAPCSIGGAPVAPFFSCRTAFPLIAFNRSHAAPWFYTIHVLIGLRALHRGFRSPQPARCRCWTPRRPLAQEHVFP